MVITDDMVQKAKKLYRKVNSDSEKTLENEFEKKKAAESIELNSASIDEILEINQDEIIDDLDLSLEYELDLDLVAKQISKSNPADAQARFQADTRLLTPSTNKITAKIVSTNQGPFIKSLVRKLIKVSH